MHDIAEGGGNIHSYTNIQGGVVPDWGHIACAHYICTVSLYDPDQGQTKGDTIMGDEENGHFQRYSSVALAVHRVTRRPHGLRNDSAPLTNSIVERPSVDVEVRTGDLHGRTRYEKGVGPVLGDSRAKRPHVDTQKPSKVSCGIFWAAHLGYVSVDVEIHLRKIRF
jgi:hypothetical protein